MHIEPLEMLWCVYVLTYAGVTVAVSHDEIERGTGLAPVLINGAAAVLKHLLAKVCTLLRLLLEQQVSKLHANKPSGVLYKAVCLHTSIIPA